MDEREFFIRAAKAYNNLNFAEIEPFLSEDVTYESQGSTIKGKARVAVDLKDKFQDLKQSGRRLYAELAVIPPKKRSAENNEVITPCIILSQGVQVNRVAVIMLSVKDGIIEKIDIRTSSPHWTETQGSGIFPA